MTKKPSLEPEMVSWTFFYLGRRPEVLENSPPGSRWWPTPGQTCWPGTWRSGKTQPETASRSFGGCFGTTGRRRGRRPGKETLESWDLRPSKKVFCSIHVNQTCFASSCTALKDLFEGPFWRTWTKDALLRGCRREKSTAPSGIQTRYLYVMRCALHRCATAAATVKNKVLKKPGGLYCKAFQIRSLGS